MMASVCIIHFRADNELVPSFSLLFVTQWLEMICYPVILIYPTSYREISFPPLTEEHEKELEVLRNMKEEDIDTDDIPKTDFTDAEFYYSEIRPKNR